jgi:hypothetical protein
MIIKKKRIPVIKKNTEGESQSRIKKELKSKQS